MSDPGVWLAGHAGGLSLLIAMSDLREVVAPGPVALLPGGSRGIRGVMVHQGEFLPVLAWEDLPGGSPLAADPVVLALLRPRLGLPLERMAGTITLGSAAWEDLPESDARGAWVRGQVLLEGGPALLVDPDRLVGLLRRFRGNR